MSPGKRRGQAIADFGMQAFDTEEEAVALANNSEYGLAASVWSTNVDRPLRIARQIDAGTIWINNWAIIYDETEEGGYSRAASDD